MRNFPSFPAPAEWHPRIAEYLAGRLEPVPARLAATVLLLRDGADGPEVHLVKRATTMAFAGGLYAFPGGRVDPQDEDAATAWAGPSPEQWATRFDCAVPQARALVGAAVRETFEETGVLLAGSAPETVVGATSSADWEADRLAVEAHALPLGALLTRRGLTLRTDLLAGWSRWVTPAFEPRRYDTAFFVAALPEGQSAREVSGETEGTVWTTPSRAIADFEAGHVAMLPPTVTTLREIAAFDSTAAVLAAASARSLAPIMADVRAEADGTFSLIWPIADR